jgi:hypothetical protein
MSAEESKHQIDWAERDLAIILTLLWQCLRSAPQRRAELGRHRTTPGVGIPAAARRSHRDLAASRRDPHYRKRPRPAHGLGPGDQFPVGGCAVGPHNQPAHRDLRDDAPLLAPVLLGAGLDIGI